MTSSDEKKILVYRCGDTDIHLVDFRALWSKMIGDGVPLSVQMEADSLWDELKYAFAEMLARADECKLETLAAIEEDENYLYEIITTFADQFFWTAVSEIEETLIRLGLLERRPLVGRVRGYRRRSAPGDMRHAAALSDEAGGSDTEPCEARRSGTKTADAGQDL